MLVYQRLSSVSQLYHFMQLNSRQQNWRLQPQPTTILLDFNYGGSTLSTARPQRKLRTLSNSSHEMARWSLFQDRFSSPIWRFPEIGVPPNHPLECDFPWNQPSSYGGSPFMGTPATYFLLLFTGRSQKERSLDPMHHDNNRVRATAPEFCQSVRSRPRGGRIASRHRAGLGQARFSWWTPAISCFGKQSDNEYVYIYICVCVLYIIFIYDHR